MTRPTRDLDVRPLLAEGQEPFAAIMAATDALAPGESLRLIAPFRPVPLFGVMAKRGFIASDRALGGGDWEVIFSPACEEPSGPEGQGVTDAALWPDPSQMLDLEGLMPPEPMVRILETLEEMRVGEVLFAALGREPVFLFPELAARGHEWAGGFSSDGATYRLMVRRGAGDA